jgi:hypothetical protein
LNFYGIDMTTMTDTPFDPADAWTVYRDGHLDELSDHQLVGWSARHLAVPREAAADSFILHAPLELAARAALLPFVEPAARDLARVRLLTLTAGFDRWGPPVGDPPATEYASIDDATTRLVASLTNGELDDVDAAAAWLGRHADGRQLRRVLTDPVLPHLGAAAHGPIFLYHLPRVAPRRELTGELARGLLRELGRYADWQLHWIDEPADREATTTSVAAAFDAVASTPLIHEPPETFIFPLMSFVDGKGIAAEQLAPLDGVSPADRVDAGRAVLRVAAWSMLLEDDTYAPYGWSHCLTMPQAALGVAADATDPLVALRVAATYVVGFRSALADHPIGTTPPEDPGVSWRHALDDDRATAAAAVWHAPVDERGAVVSELASRASIQHDAHLVKYTLACIDAAADDPRHAALFLAAAASLSAHWHQHGNDEDPLAADQVR